MSTTAACPDKECNEPVDVIVRSSDGKLFGAHSHRLALYSTAFPPCDTGGDSTVEIFEPGDVIELLLRYFHPEHEFPDTMSIRFELFDRLAEAAEKYTVHSLIEISKLRMRLSVPTYPLEVLRYAVKHDYLMLWEPAATQSLASCSSREALRIFDYGRLYDAWTSDQYADVYTWVTSTRPEPNQHSGGSHKCKIWDRYVNDIQREASRCKRSGELKNVNSFEGTMHIMGEGRFNDCSCNDAAISRWWNRVRLSDPKEFRYFYQA